MASVYKYVSSSSGGSGGGGGSVTKYSQAFNSTTDWGSASAGFYSIVISEATHAKGTNPSIEVFESAGLEYEAVQLYVKVNSSGDVTIRVTETPDNRFSGKIVII